MTPGYVGADLSALMKEAGMNAIRRIIKIMDEKDEIIEIEDSKNGK